MISNISNTFNTDNTSIINCISNTNLIYITSNIKFQITNFQGGYIN